MNALIQISVIAVCYNGTALYNICLNWSATIPGPRREKTCLRWFANNKGADQPANLHRLISTFVICILESIISKLAASEI